MSSNTISEFSYILLNMRYNTSIRLYNTSYLALASRSLPALRAERASVFVVGFFLRLFRDGQVFFDLGIVGIHRTFERRTALQGADLLAHAPEGIFQGSMYDFRIDMGSIFTKMPVIQRMTDLYRYHTRLRALGSSTT